MFRLFISHSSHSGEDLGRLTEFVAEVEQMAGPELDIQVLVDKRVIRSGDDWRKRISYMLHVCDGGVVLINDNALESSWVLAEATILSMRRRHDEGFRFIPIALYLDDAELEAARRTRQKASIGDWKVVALEDVQWAKGSTPTELADKVVAGLRAGGLPLVQRDSPINRLASQLSGPLSKAGVKSLRHLADELDDGDIDRATTDPVLQSAFAIAKAMIRAASLVATRKKLDTFGRTYSDEDRASVLEALAPLAYPAALAALLRQCVAEGARIQAAVLETNRPNMTIDQLVNLAHLPDKIRVYHLPSMAGVTLAQFTAALRREYRAANPRVGDRDNTFIDELLQRLDKPVAMCGPVDSTVLEQIADAYPRLPLVIHYPFDGSIHPRVSGTVALVPPIGEVEERNIELDFFAAMEALE